MKRRLQPSDSVMGGAYLLVALSAVAAPARARLEYEPPSGGDCQSAQELRDAIAVRLGYDPFDATVPQRVAVALTRRDSGWLGHVQLSDEEGKVLGERDLKGSSTSCRPLGEAVALAISVALDPLGAGKSALPAQTVSAAPKPPTPPSSSGPPLEVHAQVGLVGALGAAPSPSVGVDLQAELRSAHLLLAVGVRDDFPAAFAEQGGTVQTSLIAAELVPCVHQSHWGECLLATAGSQSAGALNIPNARSGNAPFFAAGARVYGELAAAERLSLQAALELWFPVTRTSVLVGGAPVWTTSSVAGALTLSANVKIL